MTRAAMGGRLAAACLLLGALGCGRRERPNVVLVTIDTLRADRLSPYGGQVPTPTVQALADAGIVFERAFCEATWTIPSMASVLTGTYPTTHGVQTPFGRLGSDAVTLAERLHDAGYHTAAIVSSYPLDHEYGFAQGFETYDDTTTRRLRGPADHGSSDEHPASFETERGAWIDQRIAESAYRPDDETAARAVEWLRAAPDGPYFLWVHFFGPHAKPNAAGKLPSRSTRRRRYDEDVRSMDEQLGRVLAQVDPGRTVVVFHSDHGETLDEHASVAGHGFDLYDTTAHVPLLIRLRAGARAGTRVSVLVRNLDIFATVLTLAGVPVPPGVPSRDLLGDLSSRTPILLSTSLTASGPIATTQVYDGDEVRVGRALRGVRTSRWKLIVSQPVVDYDWPERDRHAIPPAVVERLRRTALFDVRADPGEQHDLARDRPGVAARLARRLPSFEPGAGSSSRPLSPAAERSLRALGYIE